MGIRRRAGRARATRAPSKGRPPSSSVAAAASSSSSSSQTVPLPAGFALGDDTWGARAARRLGDVLQWLAFRCCIGAPRHAFADAPAPPPPDYDDDGAWAALPKRRSGVARLAATAPRLCRADVFCVHSTSAAGGGYNASVDDPSTVEVIDESYLGIAAALNHCCRVYAPRYRQATFAAFLFPHDRGSGCRALDLAYDDVKRAFRNFLTRTNPGTHTYPRGRPFFLLGHSQGAIHLSRLVQDVVDADPALAARMVCCYAVGAGHCGFPQDLSHLLHCHASRGPADTPGACVGMNLRGHEFTADQVSRFHALAATHPNRWDAHDGWDGAVARAQSLEPALTINPVTWREEPYGAVRTSDRPSFAYRGIVYNKPPSLLAQVRSKVQRLRALNIERRTAPFVLRAWNRPHTVVINDLTTAGDPRLREMANADDLHDESGYHLMEPTLLHFLLRENAAVRLDAFFARAAGKDVSV